MPQEVCPMCDGNGVIVDDDGPSDTVSCDACKGDGFINTEDFE